MISEHELLEKFDARACPESALQDLAIDLFLNVYRTEAVAEEIVLANKRSAYRARFLPP